MKSLPSKLEYPAVDSISELKRKSKDGAKIIVIDLENVTNIDVSCVIELVDVIKDNEQSKLINVDGKLKELLYSYGLSEQQIGYKTKQSTEFVEEIIETA